MGTQHDDHMKRVSFGPQDDVKLFVYDDGLTNSTCTFYARRSTSPPDNTLNREIVTSDDAELPRPISPPAQLEENPPPIQAVSPPLPSLIRKMENETDNPFRPEETLYHEVDPIVKAYSQRPFPPSPTSSPVPPPDLTPIKNGRHVTLDGSIGTTIADGCSKSATQSPIPHYNSTALDTTPQKHTLLHQQQGNGAQEMPPPNSAELVHVDNKKKKCACCSIQ